MTDSVTVEQKKSRRGLLALVGAGGAAAVAALLGRTGKAEAAEPEHFVSNDNSTPAVRGEHLFAGVGVQGTSPNGTGVYGHSDTWRGMYGYGGHDGVSGESLSGVGVTGASPGGMGVKGWGKPGVYGISPRNNGSGVKGEGDAPGSIGVLAKNTPDRRALRTQGRVQMDTARKVTLSNRSNLVTLPTGVQAGAFAIVLAMVQGASGNGAFVRRAWREDDKHIRITFDKNPANPTAVGYWVVQTG